MAFKCPNCSENTLSIERALELPPDAREDEITLQVLICARCGFEGLAVYGESRRGALDSEAWRHEGYRVSAEDLAKIRELVERCPAPRDQSCGCAAHEKLGSRRGDTWEGLPQNGVEVLGGFQMRWSET